MCLWCTFLTEHEVTNTFAQGRRMAERWPEVATISLSILMAIFQVNLG